MPQTINDRRTWEMKKALFICICMAILAFSSTARASLATFTFTGTNASGDSLVFTDSTTGLTLTVTAYVGTRNFVNLTPATATETSAGGLGVSTGLTLYNGNNESSSLVDNRLNYIVDGVTRVGMEYLLLTFSEEVTLATAVFGSTGTHMTSLN